MYIPQTGWPQMMVDPMQQMYWQESYRANCELAVAMTKADIELRKKSLEAQIRENEHERMEKIRSDVRSARELQKTEVMEAETRRGSIMQSSIWNRIILSSQTRMCRSVTPVSCVWQML